MESKRNDRLEAFLDQIREHGLEKFATAVELDRVGGGAEMPHEHLLDVMRPALRENVHAKRVPTPERMFCIAFEDLINALPSRRKQFGRISRSSIRPMWNWLKEDLLPGDFERVENSIRELIVNNKKDEATALVLDLQLVAGEYMHRELEKITNNEEEYKILCERLGGSAVVADFCDMAMCLEVAGDIAEIQGAFERPLVGFDDQTLADFKRIYQAFRKDKPEHAVYALLVVMGRMARPWEVLSAMEVLTKADATFEFHPDDEAVLHELLLDDVDVIGLSFVDIKPDKVDHAELLENLNIFVQTTGGVLRGIGTQRDAGRGQRFRTTRGVVARQMAGFVEVMPGLILKALPVKKAGGQTVGGQSVRISRVPDTSVVPLADAVNMSLKLTRLFTELRFYADQTGFGSAYSRAAKEFDHRYEVFKVDILDHIRASKGSELENAECFAEVLAQIGEVYRGAVEADMIRRRAATAAEEGPVVIRVASGG